MIKFYDAYSDMIAFHPAYYLLEIYDIDLMDINSVTKNYYITQDTKDYFYKVFDAQAEEQKEYIDKLIQGDTQITEEYADKAEKAFGISAKTWLTIQERYDDLVEQHDNREKKRKEVLDILDKRGIGKDVMGLCQKTQN
jgi:arylsulfatase A-like enzyme